MTREIPGFYYDSAKRKYFRIENSKTAPAQAAWSARNVKRRAIEEKEDAQRREKLQRQANSVKRTPVRKVPLMGGLLAREIGEVGGSTVPGAETLGRAWAGGLRAKGGVKLWPQYPDNCGMVSSMWVGGSDELELGIVYGALNEGLWAGAYIPRDADDKISCRHTAERYPGVDFRPRLYTLSDPIITSIKFHDSSGTILLASNDYRGGPICIRQFKGQPQNSGDPSRNLVLEENESVLLFSGRQLHGGPASTIHALQPAPYGSRLTCIAGTDRGIVQLQNQELAWLTPPSDWSPRRFRERTQPWKDRAPWQGDILSVDFLTPNSAEVILAGTRSSHVCVLDLRAPPDEWSAESSALKHASSAAHVRCVGPYTVLAAGPQNAMALYDVRFLQRQQLHQNNPAQWGGRRRWGENCTRPVVEFPSYRNQEHIHIGLDVLTEPGYGSAGIVAAAHGDETVALYSLGDGSRIPVAAVDGIKAHAVVRSLMWQTLPGDRHPSLFVGEGPWIRKYSFWA
ncbi:hypothetical protein C8A03DRAFT_31580 [Achaetomium macrosporum]|uniref:Myocyte-specific enhancer factor 2d n=1 Tax=Achaetomium macrosporum TaxID=79813 RepID=A0AAN7CG53_9PEZI|nr:hypothetical protein C8A03DRAFT_31580 [Achaetomium macrosporum]